MISYKIFHNYHSNNLDKKKLVFILSTFLLSFFLLIILVEFFTSSITFIDAIAESPSFVKQEITDPPNDWLFWKVPLNSTSIYTHRGYSIDIDNSKNMSECKIDTQLVSPDIHSVSYISDGKFLNATIWLTSEFMELPIKDSIDTFQEIIELQILKSSLSLENYTALKKALLYDPEIYTNLTILEENSYFLDENPAHKITYVVEEKETEKKQKKITKIWSIKNNKSFDITYTASVDSYSQYLATFQKMIDSFKIEPSEYNNETNLTTELGNYSKEFSLGQDQNFAILYPIDWEKKEKNIDGVTKFADIKFISPYDDLYIMEPSWHEITYTMALDIDSVHDPGGTDYRIKIARIHDNGWTEEWTRQVEEVSAYDDIKVLEELNNLKGFFENGKPFATFSFDLTDANLPERFKVVFYVTDYFVKDHHFCRLIDTTNWVHIPPPVFSMSKNPNSLLLRPGEEINIELQIKGNTDLESKAILSSTNVKGINLNFIPNKIVIPSSGIGTSKINIKTLDNTEPQLYTIPIDANISFPNTITNRGGEIFNNSKSVSIKETSNLTVNVLPALKFEDHLTRFTDTWITPLSGIWTFAAAVAAVLVPLYIKVLKNKDKDHLERKK